MYADSIRLLEEARDVSRKNVETLGRAITEGQERIRAQEQGLQNAQRELSNLESGIAKLRAAAS